MSNQLYDGIMLVLGLFMAFVVLGVSVAVALTVYHKLQIWFEKRAIRQRNQARRVHVKNMQRADYAAQRDWFREMKS